MDIGAYIEQNREALTAWGKLVCSEITGKHGALLKVPASFRVKDPKSARAKQLKKAYADPAAEMTDLVGVRFVVLTSTDLAPIRSQLEHSASWECKVARDPDDEIERAPDTFGYQSHHYEVRPACSTGDLWCCEVQVRTLLQHTIAELSHDAMYKATQKVPSQAKRLVARSMALMETTDELLCRAMVAVREAEAPALAMQRVAGELTRTLEGGDRTDLLEDLFSSYGDFIIGSSAAELRTFCGDNQFILDRVRERNGEGLFSYPAAAVVAYWLVGTLERKVSRHWPFPGSKPELDKIFSDLGIAP
jgi:putative GTP pyrophosphokinase